MAVYLVAYDLVDKTDIGRYRRVGEAIEALGDSREVQRSVWLVVSDQSVRDIFDVLRGDDYVRGDDRLLVMHPAHQYEMQGPDAAWLEKVVDG